MVEHIGEKITKMKLTEIHQVLKDIYFYKKYE